jgi:hypothetical protein
MSEQRRAAAVAYWVLAAVLVVFGFLSLFSVGAPFLLTGVAMLVVGRWRRNRAVLWPALVAVWAFVAGYVLVAPLSCQTSSGMDPMSVCSYALGLIRWHGSGNPSLMPAFLVGCVSAAIGALVARRLLLRSLGASIPG